MDLAGRLAALIPPYGGTLVNLLCEDAARLEVLDRAKHLPSVQISSRSVCDLEMLAVGAFSPLDRFMGEQDYRGVLESLRLADGTIFPIPVTLPVDAGKDIKIGSGIALRAPTNEVLAVMRVDEVYPWDLAEEATRVIGTTDSRHSLVSEMHTWGKYCLSGPLTVVNLPRYRDFPALRRTPAEVRSILARMGRNNVAGYQPPHPMHRAHEALTKAVAEESGGSLLINPIVGMTAYSDMGHYNRIRCYQALIDRRYDPARTLLNLTPLAVRMAGPRAGLWHGIINRNYGVNHFIVGRDPHCPEKDVHGKAFCEYSSEIQQRFRNLENEIGVRMVPIKEMVYLPTRKRYEASERAIIGKQDYIRVSTNRIIEESVFRGTPLPEWFTYPEVARILQEAHPPRTRQGFCIWLTGLPSSGKSTIADILAPLLMARGKKVTLLDGDVVRTHLTKGLGFSRDDRVTNILRVGFVASEIVRHEGVVICALISPYTSARDQVRSMIEDGRFIEVFVDTPVSVCEVRDVKGMYGQARRGTLKGFTGVDDSYEPPRSPELRICTTNHPPEASARMIAAFLEERGFIEREPAADRQRIPGIAEIGIPGPSIS
jgi:sulfate adenylyltransferase